MIYKPNSELIRFLKNCSHISKCVERLLITKLD